MNESEGDDETDPLVSISSDESKGELKEDEIALEGDCWDSC